VAGTSINPELFEEAFSSKYGKVRIFKVLKVSKKSKKWSADPVSPLYRRHCGCTSHNTLQPSPTRCNMPRWPFSASKSSLQYTTSTALHCAPSPFRTRGYWQANRICDAPGSWYCVGQYPPALDELMNKKKAFKQLEDFNKGASTENNTHYQKYMKAMGGK
jgi:hypothetical protein